MNRAPVSETSRVYLVGGGIASMAAAAFLIRDGDMPGHRITIFEESDVIGGSLDGSGSPDTGYVLRGGRMLESKYLCTFDLFDSIPTLDGAQTVTQETLAWNATIDFRLAPVDRDALLAEKLANVPDGTFLKFESEKKRIVETNLDNVLPNDHKSTIDEQFNIMRVDLNIRVFHNFSQNWFGKLTAESVMLLSKWGFVKDGEMKPGSIQKTEKVLALLTTQGITLPENVEISQLKGLEWNERLALQIGRLRETSR